MVDMVGREGQEEEEGQVDMEQLAMTDTVLPRVQGEMEAMEVMVAMEELVVWVAQEGGVVMEDVQALVENVSFKLQILVFWSWWRLTARLASMAREEVEEQVELVDKVARVALVEVEEWVGQEVPTLTVMGFVISIPADVQVQAVSVVPVALMA